MSWKDVTPGNKIAKIRAARFITTKTGTFGLEVSFEFLEESSSTMERINWVGWLSQKAIEGTMDTLVNTLGYNGTEQCDENGLIIGADAFAYGREVQLVVEPDEYEGKTYMKVKWVNSIGGSAYNGCTPETIKSNLATSGFKAQFLAFKKNVPAATAPKPTFNSEEKLPF